jgi:hypothetical protein
VDPTTGQRRRRSLDAFFGTRRAGGPRSRAGLGAHDPALGAGAALALIYPLLRLGRHALDGGGHTERAPCSSEGKGCMKRKPTIRSLETLSLDEAIAYLEHAGGDELDAACALAWDRNRMDGSAAAPDDAEVHHAYFLLCRARGLFPPSFDDMRVELRRRVAA